MTPLDTMLAEIEARAVPYSLDGGEWPEREADLKTAVEINNAVMLGVDKPERTISAILRKRREEGRADVPALLSALRLALVRLTEYEREHGGAFVQQKIAEILRGERGA